jgi:polyisoprenoid-binding protein YceI
MTLRSPRRLAAAIAVALAAAAPVGAQARLTAAAPASSSAASGSTARAHDVDKAHSEINFVATSRLLDAHGHFGAWDADVQIDPEALERSSVRLTIDAASINTRNDRRDGHLKGADFFDVANHATITFVSRSVAKSSPTQGTITGDLTVRGVTRSIEVPVSLVFYQNGRGRFRGAFTINRKDYGVSYDSKLNPIGDQVEVQFNMSVAEKKA